MLYSSGVSTLGTKYSRMGQAKFVKGYLSQILNGPFLNTLSHLFQDYFKTQTYQRHLFQVCKKPFKGIKFQKLRNLGMLLIL